MTTNTEEKLKGFVGVSTWMSTHWADEERFHQFIVEAYKEGDTALSLADFESVVNSFEANKTIVQEAKSEKIGRMHSLYQSGMGILKLYDGSL